LWYHLLRRCKCKAPFSLICSQQVAEHILLSEESQKELHFTFKQSQGHTLLSKKKRRVHTTISNSHRTTHPALREEKEVKTLHSQTVTGTHLSGPQAELVAVEQKVGVVEELRGQLLHIRATLQAITPRGGHAVE
jgi:hypothetical protein